MSTTATATTTADEITSSGGLGPNVVQQRYADVLRRVAGARAVTADDIPRGQLVVVTKTQPAELLKHAFWSEGEEEGGGDDTAAGATSAPSFRGPVLGENYVQELLDKSAVLPRSVEFHFIGHLQSNKARQVVGVPNVTCVQSVDSLKLARQLNKEVLKQNGETGAARVLGIMLQVNTSGEDTKSGLEPPADAAGKGQAPLLSLARAVHGDELAGLELRGLMTIGTPPAALQAAREAGSAVPDDFGLLRHCRDVVALELGIEAHALKLSMGMSHDFEDALRAGADHVRVGSAIFGARPQPVKKD